MRLNRRQLLVLTGSSYFAFLQTRDVSASAVAASTLHRGPLVVAGGQGPVISTLSEHFDVLYQVSTPAVLEFSPTNAPVRASIVFDRRIFSPASKIAVAVGEKWTTVLTTVNAIDDKRGIVEFEFDAHGSPATVATPLSRRDLYPAENIGRPSPLIVGAQVGDGRGSRFQFATRPTERAIQAWGAELFVTWSTIPIRVGKQNSAYSYPAGVLVKSVGPTSIPAGANLIIEVDPRIIDDVGANPSPLRAVLDGAQPIPQGNGRYKITFADAIPAGESAWVELVASGRDDATIDGVSFAIVTISAGSPGTEPRKTGRMFSSDLTNSGQPTRPAGERSAPWAEGSLA